MSESWVKISKKIGESKNRRFREIVEKLCCDSVLVILFGSRAKGEETPLSDFDLLVVKNEHRGDRLAIEWPVQMFVYGLSEIHLEIEKFNTVVVDAFWEGKLLCGDRKLFDELRQKVLEIVEARKLRKTSHGWLRLRENVKAGPGET